jgi:CubicO group peptidase (beta-lactamase class C family)
VDEHLPAAVDALAAETGFAGVVRVTERGTPSFTAAYGLADRARGVPNTAGTRFAIASGTKSFTALAVLRLVESGLLELATTARSVLGTDLPLVDDRVTVEHLLTHRSGIGDYFDEEVADVHDYVLTVPLHTLSTTEAWLPVLDARPQVSPPGEVFAYNNSGFIVLALVAERISNVAFPALVEQLVLGPAGLASTGFHRSDTPTSDLAVGYVDEIATNLTNVLHLPVVGTGDGGLSTTLDDVDRFWRALLEGEICSATTVADLVRDRSGAEGADARYGLGFWLAAEGDAVWLEGMDAGISFRSVHRAGAGVTWTVMSNSTDGAWPIARLLADRPG